MVILNYASIIRNCWKQVQIAALLGLSHIHTQLLQLQRVLPNYCRKHSGNVLLSRLKHMKNRISSKVSDEHFEHSQRTAATCH